MAEIKQSPWGVRAGQWLDRSLRSLGQSSTYEDSFNSAMIGLNSGLTASRGTLFQMPNVIKDVGTLMGNNARDSLKNPKNIRTNPIGLKAKPYEPWLPSTPLDTSKIYPGMSYGVIPEANEIPVKKASILSSPLVVGNPNVTNIANNIVAGPQNEPVSYWGVTPGTNAWNDVARKSGDIQNLTILKDSELGMKPRDIKITPTNTLSEQSVPASVTPNKSSGLTVGQMAGLGLGLFNIGSSIASSVKANKKARAMNRKINEQISTNKALAQDTRTADEAARYDTKATVGQSIDELRMTKSPEDRSAIVGNVGNAYQTMLAQFRAGADTRRDLSMQNAQLLSMKQKTTSPLLAGISGAFQGLGGTLGMGSQLLTLIDKYKNPGRYANIASADKRLSDYSQEEINAELAKRGYTIQG